MKIDDVKTIKFSPDGALNRVEELAESLRIDSPIKLRLPSGLNSRGALGVEVALIQAIGTWIRHNPHKKILHTYQDNQPGSYKSLCESIYGIAALSLAEEIWDMRKNRVSKSIALQEAVSVIESLRRNETSGCFKSRYFGVPYIRTPRYDKELDMPFYNGDKVVELEAFSRTVEKILYAKVGGRSRFQSLKEMLSVEDLSDLLWELLKNTNDHGRMDEVGNTIPVNFRSLIMQQQDLTKQYLASWSGEAPTPAQAKFCEHWMSQDTRKMYFVDLSVVDLGEGFTRLARSRLKSDDPVELLCKCFESGWSRLRGPSRGDGLTKVLAAVNKYKGWLRVRTGNVLLEKTFSDSNDYKITENDVVVMPTPVAGTSVHISLPLRGYR